MDALLQRAEVLHAPSVAVDHDLAVEHVAAGRERELREVARRAACRRATGHELVAVDERDRAEAVVLRLVGPLLADGSSARERASWGSIGGFERQRHDGRC